MGLGVCYKQAQSYKQDFLEVFMTVPVCSSGLGACAIPVQNMWEVRRKPTQGTHHGVDQMLGSLDSLFSSFFRVFLFLFVVLCPGIFSCKKEERGEWNNSIFMEPENCIAVLKQDRISTNKFSLRNPSSE